MAVSATINKTSFIGMNAIVNSYDAVLVTAYLDSAAAGVACKTGMGCVDFAFGTVNTVPTDAGDVPAVIINNNGSTTENGTIYVRTSDGAATAAGRYYSVLVLGH
jgi:hypothetical protein